MNDREINTLLRMAMEAEALEAGPVTTPRRVTPWGRVGLIAAGVAAAVVAAAWLRPNPTPTPLPPVARNDVPAPAVEPALADEPAPATAGGASGGSMILALFRHPETRCECVVWRESPFAGRKLADVGRTELIAAALRESCDPRGGDLLLVVGLEGPREYMPPTKEAARALASCLVSGTTTCGEENSCYSAGAMQCVPEPVNVVTETLAMAPR